MKSPIQD